MHLLLVIFPEPSTQTPPPAHPQDEASKVQLPSSLPPQPTIISPGAQEEQSLQYCAPGVLEYVLSGQSEHFFPPDDA